MLADYLAPENYEEEEWSRPDEIALFTLFWSTVQSVLDDLPDCDLVDVCCGTGLSLLGVEAHSSIRSAHAFDLDADRVRFAQSRLGHNPKIKIFCDDALTWLGTDQTFDVALLSSAYHHIEHALQPELARRVRRCLRPGGYAIFAENIVPHYDAPLSAQYASAVRRFYATALEHAIVARPKLSERVRGLVRENVDLALKGEIEFKVCRATFVSQLEACGFELIKETRAWPQDEAEIGPEAGNVVFVFRASDRDD